MTSTHALCTVPLDVPDVAPTLRSTVQPGIEHNHPQPVADNVYEPLMFRPLLVLAIAPNVMEVVGLYSNRAASLYLQYLPTGQRAT